MARRQFAPLFPVRPPERSPPDCEGAFTGGSFVNRMIFHLNYLPDLRNPTPFEIIDCQNPSKRTIDQ